MLVLDDREVRERLDMESCIAAMEDVPAQLARGEMFNLSCSRRARRERA